MAGWGMCQCGCGGAAPIADRDRRERGYVKGWPMRWIKGHCNRVPRRYEINHVTGCWEWQNHRNAGGYGVTREPDSYGRMLAHRYYYELARGPVPDGLQLDHLCRNRACVNPRHLEAVPSVVNTLRGGRTKFTETEIALIRSAPTVATAMAQVDVSEAHARQVRRGLKRKVAA